MPDIRDRFRSLDNQGAPDLWNEASVRSRADSPQPSWLPRIGGALAVATVVVLGVFIGLRLTGSPPPGGPGPSPSQDSGVVSATVVDGDFQLTITAPKATWGTDEAIEVEATLKYLGSADETTIRGSSGLLGFGIEEVDGDRSQGPAFTTDCAPYVISASEPLTSPFEKSGGWSPEDPDAAFWEAYFADPELRLPSGEWRISVGATFDEGDDCTASPMHLSVAITLTVEGDSEPSAEPTGPVEPSVEPSAEPSGPEPAFICGQAFGQMDAEGSDFHPLIVADIRLGTHDGYDRIVFEYVDDGTPELQVDRAEPPFVMNPSGLPLTVDGSPVYSVTFIGAAKYDMETGEQPYTGSTDFTPGYEQIAQFVEYGDFEAVHNWYLGTNGSSCLRAFTLDSPSRLVIDIQH